MRQTGWPFALGVLASLGGTLLPTTGFADGFCQDQDPILNIRWSAAFQGPEAIPMGSWQLPKSSAEPDRFTKAWADLTLDYAPLGDVGEKAWHAVVTLRYPTDGLGLFFTFQAIRMTWTDPDTGKPRTKTLDWSEGCQDPGRSLAPGGSWSVRIPLDTSETLLEPQFSLYGSQN